VETVARFGELYGLAFQLSDDLIDIVSAAADTGKTPGTDLREGIRTLPVLLVLASSDADSARLRELLSGSLDDDGDLAEALALLRAHPAMAEARRRLLAYADEARAVAAELPDGACRGALLAITEYVLARTG
jgi:heptaprenyl diphosphate synthase